MGLIGNNKREVLTLGDQLKEYFIGMYKGWQENMECTGMCVKVGAIEPIYDIIKGAFEKMPDGKAVSLDCPDTFIIIPGELLLTQFIEYGTISLIQPSENFYCKYDPEYLPIHGSPARIYDNPCEHPWITCMYSGNSQPVCWRAIMKISLRYDLYRCPREFLEPAGCLKKILMEIKRWHDGFIPGAPVPTRDIEEIL